LHREQGRPGRAAQHGEPFGQQAPIGGTSGRGQQLGEARRIARRGGADLQAMA
jgi:hypothetical protein